jgi:hypothetical protein
MDDVTSQEKETLLAELERARGRLDGLVRDLRAIDRELEELSPARAQHRLLQDACAALEGLAEVGAAGLFWGDEGAARAGEVHLLRVRSRLDGFAKGIGEIDQRREAVLEEIERQQDETGRIEADVFEAEEAEEKLRQEWIIEREISALPAHDLVMPWTRGGEDDDRFRRALRAALAASLLFALVVPWIELPVHPPEEAAIEVPERVVRLMMESRPLPPRQEVVPRPAEEKPPVAQQPVPQPPPKPSAGPGKGPGEGPGAGPAKGLLAFREQLSVDVEPQLSRLGSQARVSTAGAASGVVQRSMVTSLAPGSSGGINLAELSRGVGGGGGSGGGPAIAGVQIARATSSIGGGGGGRSSQSVGGGGATPGRTDEEIQIVFDRHKAGLYRLYNRELRRDPTLKGQIILRLRIEPDGSVSICEVQGTDMDAPNLAGQVVERVRGFDFGAKEGIAAVTILYPIDFLPAA